MDSPRDRGPRLGPSPVVASHVGSDAEPQGRVQRQHELDLSGGGGSVALPDALDSKYVNAPWEWGWQWVFPAARLYEDPATGRRRRHHVHETVVQREFATLRHSFATHLLEAGCDTGPSPRLRDPRRCPRDQNAVVHPDAAIPRLPQPTQAASPGPTASRTIHIPRGAAV